MPNTFIGLIILIAFLIPGFIAVISTRREVPLFSARQSQLEIVLWGCLLSIISHILSYFIVKTLACVFWDGAREIIRQILNAKPLEIFTELDNNNKTGNLISFALKYFLINSIVAWLLGFLLAKIINKTNLFIDLQSVWVSAFDKKNVYFARALLDNNYLVSGTTGWTQTDPESIISGNRDILFESPEITNDRGKAEEQVAETVIINMRNVKILELSTAKPNKLLFSVGLEYQTDLDKNNISDNLQQEFNDNKNLLSQNVTVSIEEKYSKWLITDKDNKKTYSVKKERDKLNIYQNNKGGIFSWLKKIMRRNRKQK